MRIEIIIFAVDCYVALDCKAHTRRLVVVLQQVRLSHRFPQTIWHPEPSVRRLLSDTATGLEPEPVPVLMSTLFLAVFPLLLLLPSPGVVTFGAVTETRLASSGCNVAECMP
jgi:hypothetical protein